MSCVSSADAQSYLGGPTTPPPAAAPAQAAATPAAPAAATPASPVAKKAVTAAAKVPSPEKLANDTPRTRFMIGVDSEAKYHVFSLRDPDRVIVEISHTKLLLPDPMTKPVGLIKSFTSGLSAHGRSRVEIQFTSPIIFQGATYDKGRDGKLHLVLDMVSAEDTKARRVVGKLPQPSGTGAGGLLPPAAGLVPASATVVPPIPRPALSPSAKAATTYKPIIVIDPGHGGHDSGATKNGAVEKDVVLAFSLTLRAKLLATGRYNVLMTRDTDVFIPLDNRREFGDSMKAALFIAVHADYAGGGARGATIYSLRDTVATQMLRSAKGRTTEGLLSGDDVKQINAPAAELPMLKALLGDYAARDIELTKERTNAFTRIVIDNMSEATAMRQSPDQQAAFRVLKSAKVPSVLIELAYVSNAQDARNLKSDEWRSKVSTTIVSAVENYFSNQASRLP